MIYATDFGQFISEQKHKHSLQSKELAEMLDISMGYLSQLEHGKRVCPDQELLKKLIEVFNLNEEERCIIFDLYEKASGKLSPDIVEYVQSKDIVILFTRFVNTFPLKPRKRICQNTYSV